MIITFLLNIFYGLINYLTGILPVGHLPSAILSAFTLFFGLMNQFSFVFPVATIIQAMIVVLVFDSAMIVWYVLNWVLHKLPFMN